MACNVSVERRAKPSIADWANGGTGASATISSASTRPSGSVNQIISVGRGCRASRTILPASSTVSIDHFTWGPHTSGATLGRHSWRGDHLLRPQEATVHD